MSNRQDTTAIDIPVEMLASVRHALVIGSTRAIMSQSPDESSDLSETVRLIEERVPVLRLLPLTFGRVYRDLVLEAKVCGGPIIVEAVCPTMFDERRDIVVRFGDQTMQVHRDCPPGEVQEIVFGLADLVDNVSPSYDVRVVLDFSVAIDPERDGSYREIVESELEARCEKAFGDPDMACFLSHGRVDAKAGRVSVSIVPDGMPTVHARKLVSVLDRESAPFLVAGASVPSP